jgi:hypothetical protein
MSDNKLKPKFPKSKINIPFVTTQDEPGVSPMQGFVYNPARYRGGHGTQFAFPLPPESRGPIRAREARRQKGRRGY